MTNTGAEWEIAIDGRPLTYRDDKEIAREAGRYAISKTPSSKVTVRNIVTGEVLDLGSASVAWADRR